jgi:hypothetical protein
MKCKVRLRLSTMDVSFGTTPGVRRSSGRSLLQEEDKEAGESGEEGIGYGLDGKTSSTPH